MKKTIFVLSTVLVMVMLISSAALAGEETVFSGNLRLHYNKLYNDAKGEWNEDSFGLHFLELRAAKQVGAMGVFVNHRIGDVNNNYLYEGWVSWKMGELIGTACTIKLGLVPVPFGIFANGLYYPKGIPYAKNWMWDYDYGARYDGTFKLSDALAITPAVAYLSKENSAGELGAFSAGDCPKCTGERDTISGRIGVDLKAGDALGVKAGGSVQLGKLMREGQEEKDDKLGIAGDVTISPKLPIPVSLLGEFINYSLGEDDALKGNILMGQLDVTPVQKMGMLDKAILSLHMGMNMPTEGKSVTNLIAQLRLIMCKQFNIFAQVYGDMVEDADEMTGKGLRIWFMYVF
jgi:hypothetical protein